MSGAGAAVRRALTDPSSQSPGALPGGRVDRARRRGAHQVRRARGTLVQDLDGAFPGARVLQELHAGPLVTLPGDEATAPDGSPLRGWCGDAPVTGGEPPLTAWAGAWTDAPRDAAGSSAAGTPPRTGLAPGPGTVFEVVSRFPDAASAEEAATSTVTSPTACRGRRAGEVWQVQGQPSVRLAAAAGVVRPVVEAAVARAVALLGGA